MQAFVTFSRQLIHFHGYEKSFYAISHNMNINNINKSI